MASIAPIIACMEMSRQNAENAERRHRYRYRVPPSVSGGPRPVLTDCSTCSSISARVLLLVPLLLAIVAIIAYTIAPGVFTWGNAAPFIAMALGAGLAWVVHGPHGFGA